MGWTASTLTALGYYRMTVPMLPPLTWQSAYVATTIALGDTLADADASLDDADRKVAQSLTSKLSHPDKSVRTRALASAVGSITTDLLASKLG